MGKQGFKENQGILIPVLNNGCKRWTIDRPTGRTKSPSNDSEKGFQYLIFKILSIELRRRIPEPWVDPRFVLLILRLKLRSGEFEVEKIPKS